MDDFSRRYFNHRRRKSIRKKIIEIMFKNTTIKIVEGTQLVEVLKGIKLGLDEFYDITPFKIANRINRQLSKLVICQTETDEAQKATLLDILGEEVMNEKVAAAEKKREADKEEKVKGAQLSDILTADQLNTYSEAMGKEVMSDVVVGLLSEDFSDLFEESSLPNELTGLISSVIDFYDSRVWNPVVEDVEVEEA